MEIHTQYFYFSEGEPQKPIDQLNNCVAYIIEQNSEGLTFMLEFTEL